MALNSKSKSKDHDLSRAERKAKKRKAEDAVPDLPGDDAAGEEDAIETVPVAAKRRRLRGEGGGSLLERKAKKAETEATEAPTRDEEEEAHELTEAPRKTKKERKAERKAAEAATAGGSTEAAAGLPRKKVKKQKNSETEQAADVAEADEEAEATEAKKRKNNRNREKRRKSAAESSENNETGAAAEEKKTAPRFIVFVGNLPYSTTTASLTAHFAALNPVSIRHLTQKSAPAKSQGFAFVEFAGYDTMKTALRRFHHGEFEGRKINVELTAGGGGKAKARKAKIGEKNFKLREERARRAKAEEVEKVGKRAGAEEGEGRGESAVHPSRRGRLPGGR